MIRPLVVGGLLLICYGSASAQEMLHASFDCAKAGTVVEKTICGSSDLSMKDGTVAAMYRKALAHHPSNHARLQASQRAFLRDRDSCPNKVPISKLVSCIDDAYLGRSDELNGASGGNVNIAPLTRGDEH